VGLLARHRRFVALGLVVAVLAGLAADRRVAEPAASGVAVQRVLIGPSDAQAVNRDAVPIEVTLTRTKLLADLLSADASRTSIAATAGIPPARLAVKGPATMSPWVQVPLAVRATEVAAAASVPYVLTAEAADLNPIMTLTAGAPAAAVAADIVAAASSKLRALLAQGATVGPSLAVQPLGPIASRIVVQRPSHAVAVAVPLVVLVLWCAGIVIVAGITRRRRPGPTGAGDASSRGPLALLR
jgi:hypothetical protein